MGKLFGPVKFNQYRSATLCTPQSDLKYRDNSRPDESASDDRRDGNSSGQPDKHPDDHGRTLNRDSNARERNAHPNQHHDNNSFGYTHANDNPLLHATALPNGDNDPYIHTDRDAYTHGSSANRYRPNRRDPGIAPAFQTPDLSQILPPLPMARRKRIFLLLPFLALACLVPSLLSAVQPQTIATPQPPAQPQENAGQPIALVTADPNATPTPTPFLPFKSEQIPITTTEIVLNPTSPTGPPWGSYPGPSVNPSIEVPPPVGVLPQPPGQVNILLLGSDQRPNEGGFRTDTIILLSVNPEAGTATMTSFPRDLYVYIPGWTMQRINTAQQHGGFPLTQLTFEYNFGVRPDKFVMVNFWGFKQMINSLGGIYINASRSLTDHRDRYGNYTVPAGTVYMDGDTALWYARSRYSTSDFDRTRRQQEVIQGIFTRLLSLDAIQQAPDLYDIYRQNVTMNLAFEDIQPFLPLAAQIGETDSIRNFFVGNDNVIHWRTPGGAAVLLPERDEVVEIMKQALSVPE